MALGNWKILNRGTWEAFDVGSDAHQALINNPPGNELALRDEGLSGSSDQETAPLPFFGEWSVSVVPVNLATYTAGGIAFVFDDPTDPSLKAQLAQGAGSPSAAGVIDATAGAARGTMLHGPIPKGTKIRAHTLTGAGTGYLVVRATKWAVPT